MNWDAIGAVGEVVGAIGVIVTLAYLALQIRQSNRQEAMQGVQAAIEGFVSTYAGLTANETDAANFRSGLNNFDAMPRNDKSIFHSKMQLLAGRYYQVLSLYRNGVLLDKELFLTSEVVFLSILLSPGTQQWWASYKHLPPKSLTVYLERRMEEERSKIVPASKDLQWYGSD